ncbi:MAG: lipoprotein-releasing ABC transporter permease subunit [Pelagibacteraceae bacterium]
MFNKSERIIALRNLKPKKKEGFLKIISIFSFLGIMLGVAILIIVMSVMNGFRTELTNKILGFNPHIIIKPYNNIISEDFKVKLKSDFKDFKITEAYNGEAVLITNDLAKGIMIKGLEENKSYNYEFLKDNIIDGSYKNFNKGSIILGKELAISLGVVVGDYLNIMSSAFISTPIGGIPKQEQFKISAVFSTGFYEFDQNVAFLNLNDALSFFNKKKEDSNLEIYLKNPILADKFKEEIEKINESFYVYTWTDLNKSFFGALKVERNVMFLILTLIIIVAAFNIISGLTILIKNKTKEIAILKTLGLSNLSITKSFFLTGFTIGLIATISGIFFGVVFSFYIEEIRYFISSTFNLKIFPPDIYFLEEMPSEINLSSVSLIFVFSLVITSLASYFPAKIITKMSTIKALKYD